MKRLVCKKCGQGHECEGTMSNEERARVAALARARVKPGKWSMARARARARAMARRQASSGTKDLCEHGENPDFCLLGSCPIRRDGWGRE